MKLCSRCEIVKPLSEFYWHSANKNWDFACKKCKRELSKNWRIENPDKKLSQQKEWYNKIFQRYGLGVGTIQRYGLKLALFVYDRAGRKCEQCDEVNDLTIHHKDRNGRNNEEKGLPVNNHLDNLIVLCRKCHGSIHGKEGGIKSGITRRRKR